MTRRSLVLVAVAAAVAAALAMPAGGGAQSSGSSGLTGWDGVNPFKCVLQNAGSGSAVPDPGADPYCVFFDKTHQSVTDLGIVQFLSLEPARSAAAIPKCFYFQSDHWRGSIVQSDGQTEIYEFYGHYFFDKARGAGGVWVTDFNINGHSEDPNQIPGIPPQYAEFLGPGTGGVQGNASVPADPSCAARAAANPASIYATPATPQPSEVGPLRVPAASPCLIALGSVSPRGIGAVRLGDGAARVRALLGAPARTHLGFLRYCLRGGGKFLVGQRMILTTSRGYRLGGIARGTSGRRFLRRFPHARPVLHQGLTQVFALARGSNVLVGIRAGRVRFLAVYERRALARRSALAAVLRRTQ